MDLYQRLHLIDETLSFFLRCVGLIGVLELSKHPGPLPSFHAIAKLFVEAMLGPLDKNPTYRLIVGNVHCHSLLVIGKGRTDKL